MFVCPTRSEARQTETSAFGAKRGLFQGHTAKTGGSCSEQLPKPKLPKGFQQSVFKGQVREGVVAGCVAEEETRRPLGRNREPGNSPETESAGLGRGQRQHNGAEVAS